MCPFRPDCIRRTSFTVCVIVAWILGVPVSHYSCFRFTEEKVFVCLLLHAVCASDWIYGSIKR